MATPQALTGSPAPIQRAARAKSGQGTQTYPEALRTPTTEPIMTSRIYVTETDTDHEYYDPSGAYGNPQRHAGWFSAKSAEYWHGAKEVFDGANLADTNTRDQNRGQGLYRTAGGRWVLRTWSNWQGETDTYSYTSPEDAREWLIFNDYDDTVRKYFGEIPDEQGPAVRSAELAFARWLQSTGIGIVGEDVDLDKLYDLWQDDTR